MRKILVTGANGLLGQHLVRLLAAKKFSVVATGKGGNRLALPSGGVVKYIPMDITNDGEVEAVLESEKPEVIVHAAAITQVDQCERDHDLCFGVNVQGTANILLFAEQYARHIVYVSTDFVFDG